AKENVLEVIAKIKEQEFIATPDIFKCKHCDYKYICPYAIL
ncbi:MAG: hypothetical protein UR34_C0009G0021, partial [candidate division WS6 bacterium GW2011_GWC1_33_20]